MLSKLGAEGEKMLCVDVVLDLLLLGPSLSSKNRVHLTLGMWQQKPKIHRKEGLLKCNHYAHLLICLSHVFNDCNPSSH